MVRGCVSAGDGLSYDQATGEFTARPSGDAGNNLSFGGDGGLYVPTGSATVTTECGLTGDGSAAAPLAAAVQAWPYPCDVDTASGVVACDSTGQLRSEPPSVYFANTNGANNSFAPVTAPASYTTVATAEMTFTNPSTCKSALVLIELEVDIDFDVPAGGTSSYRFGGDIMYNHENQGSATQFNEHTQTAKVAHIELAPGATDTFSTAIQVAGTGGTTYDRVQHILRVWAFGL